MVQKGVLALLPGIRHEYYEALFLSFQVDRLSVVSDMYIYPLMLTGVSRVVKKGVCLWLWKW